MCNSSCLPNATHVTTRQHQLRLVAARPINRGEEIFVCYTGIRYLPVQYTDRGCSCTLKRATVQKMGKTRRHYLHLLPFSGLSAFYLPPPDPARRPSIAELQYKQHVLILYSMVMPPVPRLGGWFNFNSYIVNSYDHWLFTSIALINLWGCK